MIVKVKENITQTRQPVAPCLLAGRVTLVLQPYA
jgi:hypothetical protein